MLGRSSIGAVVLALGLAGCTVDGTGIGMLGDARPVDTGSGGSGGAGGTGGSGGSGGMRPDGPALDASPGQGGDSAIPDGPTEPFSNGWPCTRGQDCTSGSCVDSVCCESPCSGPCVACSVGKTSRPDGQCRPIPVGLDPDEDCSPQSSLCGRTGTCNGNGACAMGAAGLACGPSSCSGNVVTPPSRCNGSGSCDPQPAQVCEGRLRCADALVCKGTCAGDGDCVAGSTCNTSAGMCSPAKALGVACDPDDEGRDCESGHCVDGVCCDTACNGGCSGCRLAITGVANGTCAPVPVGDDPKDACDDEGAASCGSDGVCDGGGDCRQYPDGTVCGTGCCGSGGSRLCQYVCRIGSCDENTPGDREQCTGLTNCCCSQPGRQASCVLPLTCAQDCGEEDED